MGKLRSKSGCMTCRTRRVKCDEIRPMCGQCSTKSRSCLWESTHTTFRGYRPRGGSSSAAPDERDEGGDDTVDGEFSFGERRNSPGLLAESEHVSSTASSSAPRPQTASTSPFLRSPADSSTTGGISISGQLSRHSDSYSSSVSHIIPLPTANPIQLSYVEAELVHHYAEHLGRWLDCTDASRQFTLRIPVLVKHCPILLRAVVAFAAKHRQDSKTADLAYQRCIALLIERLSLNSAMHDESLLCAIVILRFYDQLNVPPVTGSDWEINLSGTSAILRASQHHTVDLSAPTLRDAAFWVYVRQCLYSASVNQQPPNIDFNLQLHPIPAPPADPSPASTLTRETAWANKMTWICACIVQYAFDGVEVEPASRVRQSQALSNALEEWKNERPSTFNPIWQAPARDVSVFPEIWFTADWHVVAHALYHFSSLLLITHKPGPKFFLRNVGKSLTEADHRILNHARAICGSCKCSLATVPSLMTLCHTVFIWGPLMSDPRERDEVISILTYFENMHVWPTAWIINGLREQWAMVE
ncbi:hypothetical protein K505DRAFT_411392 [Melanomma pulvis-pyrius CBS 109.77]|uniref:Zn(2)-C6 fungal-type domain-containing protein n=1 Tax=Melanomma pulvis-pyrius CBS 109.77 TaxID=1314802 RepID=A0A6A6WUJ0_9PLEO|nr:hypothetical protein K505DRAFT_411392 [Melanomma pulvis-pyrius CBS 109.77]